MLCCSRKTDNVWFRIEINTGVPDICVGVHTILHFSRLLLLKPDHDNATMGAVELRR